MPENQLAEKLWGLIPWLIGLLVVAVRNEWTTKRMQKTIYDTHGDVRVITKADCAACRESCQKAFSTALSDHRSEVIRDREEHKKEIQRLHDKIDKLPSEILNLLRGFNLQ